MIFDPDAGRSVEEIYRRKWEQEWPESLKARVLAVAEAQGCHWLDVVRQGVGVVLDLMEDPAYCARLKAQKDRRECPYGFDPLLRKGRS